MVTGRTKPNVNIQLDSQGANEVLKLFGSGVDDEALEQVVQLRGVRAVIEKANAYDPNATVEAFEASLQAAISGSPLAQDPFEFRRLAKRLDSTRKLLSRIHKQETSLAADLAAYLAHYTPTGLDLEATVIVSVGGTSDGWVPREGIFVIAADWLDGDYEGLVLLASHELYHLAQEQFMFTTESDSTQKNVRATENLLIYTLMEGSATLLADPLKAKENGPYIVWFQKKYRRNLRRLRRNFYLFEVLIFRAYHDPTVNPDDLYALGFTGEMDSALYFVGYRVAQMIEKYLGHEHLLELYKQPAVQFFSSYIRLYREQEDDEFIPLSSAIERIIAELT